MLIPGLVTIFQKVFKYIFCEIKLACCLIYICLSLFLPKIIATDNNSGIGLTHNRHCDCVCVCMWGHHPIGNINSLTLGRLNSILKNIIFKLFIQNSSWGTCCKIALKWMPRNLTNKKWTLVQIMAWCHQATSHYTGQSWPRSLSPCGPQWVLSWSMNKFSNTSLSKLCLS